jgi:hypothetical protein
MGEMMEETYGPPKLPEYGDAKPTYDTTLNIPQLQQEAFEKWVLAKDLPK